MSYRQPKNSLERVFASWNRTLNAMLAAQEPTLALAVREEAQRYIITVDVSVVDGLEDIDVCLQNTVLIIRVSHTYQHQAQALEDARITTTQQRTVQRRLHLPDAIEADDIDIACHDGVLSLTIQKADASQTIAATTG